MSSKGALLAAGSLTALVILAVLLTGAPRGSFGFGSDPATAALPGTAVDGGQGALGVMESNGPSASGATTGDAVYWDEDDDDDDDDHDDHNEDRDDDHRSSGGSSSRSRHDDD